MTKTTVLINFEGIDHRSDDVTVPLPSGYDGLHWESITALNTKNFSDSDPYKAATHSGHAVGVNFDTTTATITGDLTFTLKTAYVTSIFDPTPVRFTAFDGATVVGHKTFHLLPETQTFAHFGKVFHHITGFTITTLADEEMAIDDIQVVFDGDPFAIGHHHPHPDAPHTAPHIVAGPEMALTAPMHMHGADHWMFC